MQSRRLRVLAVLQDLAGTIRAVRAPLLLALISFAVLRFPAQALEIYLTLIRNWSQLWPQAEALLRTDFLAPVAASLLCPDLLQRFIPVSIEPFDRARAFEAGLEIAARPAVVVSGAGRHIGADHHGLQLEGF